MEGGTKHFNGEVPFAMDIRGEINGNQFRVEGKGTGNGLNGYLKGKWTCSTGKLPMSWAAIASTLGYGSKVFVKYPNGITNFFQECFPGGYSQERVITFEGDGILKTYHEVTLNKGVLYNKVTIHGEGFKSESPVIKGGLKTMLPTTEYTYPFENGVRSLVHQVYPLKSGKAFVVAEQETVNRPLGNVKVKRPGYHHTKLEIKQSTDVDEDAEHIVQEEMAISYEQVIFGGSNNCCTVDQSKGTHHA